MRTRQQVLADFGEFALRSDDLDAVLAEACRLVADALGTGRAKVLELESERRTLVVRAGVGWDEGVVGRVRLEMSHHSSETYSIEAGEPVISNDVATEDRFDVPAFMKDAGVRAFANVPVFLPGGRAFGLLQVDASEPRAFDDEDSQFLRTYATILGPVIDRLLKLQALKATEERFRAIVEAAHDYAILITDPEDRITDWLPGAEAVFGWTAEEVVGRSGSILFTPEDREAGVPDAELSAAREHGSAPNVRWHLRKDGGRVFIAGSVVALRDPTGRLRGFQKIGQDVTQRRLADEALRAGEERQAFLLDLSDALRPLGSPEEIRLAAATELGRHLGASRVAYAEDVGDGEHFDVAPNYVAGVAEAVGRFRYADYGGDARADLEAGQTRVQPDIAADTRLDDAQKAALAALGVGAALTVPLVKAGRLVAFLGVNYPVAHEFGSPEIELVREVAERTWGAIERARAEERLRQNEQRSAFLVRFSDAVRGVSDPALVASEACRVLSEQLGTDRTLWAVIDGAGRDYVVRWGLTTDGTAVEPSCWPVDPDEPFAAEHLAGRPFVYAGVASDPRISDAARAVMVARGLNAGIAMPVLVSGRLVAVLSTSQRAAPRHWLPEEVAFVRALAGRAWAEIERARAEAELRASGARQAFLLRLSDALRRTADPAGAGETACRMTAEHLDIGRVAYAEIRDGPNVVASAERDRRRREMPSAASGRDAVDAFGPLLATELTAGRPAIVADAGTDPRITEGERGQWSRLAIVASCTVPVMKEGRFVAYLAAEDDRPHAWTDAEVALLTDVAERTWATIDRARAEAALRRSEERYHDVLNSMAEGYALFAPDFTILDINAETVRIDGRRRHEIVGRSHWDAFPGTERSPLGEFYRQVMRERVPGAIEFHYKWLDGRDMWIDTRAYPTPDGGVAVFWRDSTERKRAEERLRRSEHKYRTLFEWIDEGFVTAELIHDADGRVLDALYLEGNPAAARLTDGLQFNGRLFSELLPGAERHWLEVYDRVARTGVAERLERFSDHLGRWYDVHVSRVEDPDGGGTRCRVAVVFRDITDRKRAEAALRDSEERFRALATAGSYMMYRMSPDWRQMHQLSGRGMLEDTTEGGADWAETYLFPEDRPAIFAEIEEAIHTRSLFELEHRVRRADGTAGWVISRAVPILGADGEIIEWFGAGSDVTERRAAQEALREAEERYRGELEAVVRERTAELAESRNLLRATMDSSTDMIQVFAAVRDATGEIVDFRWVLNNHTSESRFGEVLGERLLQRNPGVVVEGIFDTFRRVTETGVPDQRELHYVHEQFDGWFLQCVVKLGDGVATTTKDITDWKAAQAEVLRLQEEVAQAKLRESEERFRLLVESVSDYAIFTIDTAGIVTSWPAGAAAVFGWSEAEIVGRPFDVTFVPEDRAAGVPRTERETALRDGVAPDVREHLRKDGSRIFIDGSMRPLVGMDGEIREFIKIGQDATEARRVQQALAASEERLRTLAEGIPQLVWRSADDGRWTWSSPQWRAFTGQDLAASIERGWLDALHPEDREAALSAWAVAPATGAINVEYRVRRAADGQYLWHHTRSLPVRDGAGRIVEWLGTTTDVQQLKELQERQAVLVAELQHRTRNLIAVVRSIAHQTMARTGPTEAFRVEFNHRLEALARVQGLLSRADEEPVTIEGLVRLELDALGVTAYAGDRVVLQGPAVPLRNSIVQTLALGLHELATNARKHGALSRDRGQLRITWRVHEGDGVVPELAIEWIETDSGRPSGAVPNARGYGRELLERALPYALGAKTRYELRPDGVRCRIDIPLEKKQPRARRPR